MPSANASERLAFPPIPKARFLRTQKRAFLRLCVQD
jgi:hypothetical protein